MTKKISVDKISNANEKISNREWKYLDFLSRHLSYLKKYSKKELKTMKDILEKQRQAYTQKKRPLPLKASIKAVNDMTDSIINKIDSLIGKEKIDKNTIKVYSKYQNDYNKFLNYLKNNNINEKPYNYLKKIQEKMGVDVGDILYFGPKTKKYLEENIYSKQDRKVDSKKVDNKQVDNSKLIEKVNKDIENKIQQAVATSPNIFPNTAINQVVNSKERSSVPNDIESELLNKSAKELAEQSKNSITQLFGTEHIDENGKLKGVDKLRLDQIVDHKKVKSFSIFSVNEGKKYNVVWGEDESGKKTWVKEGTNERMIINDNDKLGEKLSQEELNKITIKELQEHIEASKKDGKEYARLLEKLEGFNEQEKNNILQSINEAKQNIEKYKKEEKTSIDESSKQVAENNIRIQEEFIKKQEKELKNLENKKYNLKLPNGTELVATYKEVKELLEQLKQDTLAEAKATEEALRKAIKEYDDYKKLHPTLYEKENDFFKNQLVHGKTGFDFMEHYMDHKANAYEKMHLRKSLLKAVYSFYKEYRGKTRYDTELVREIKKYTHRFSKAWCAETGAYLLIKAGIFKNMDEIKKRVKNPSLASSYFGLSGHGHFLVSLGHGMAFSGNTGEAHNVRERPLKRNRIRGRIWPKDIGNRKKLHRDLNPPAGALVLYYDWKDIQNNRGDYKKEAAIRRKMYREYYKRHKRA